MTDEQVLKAMQHIREIGVVNFVHDMAVIDEAIRIIREKIASDANSKAVDNHDDQTDRRE